MKRLFLFTVLALLVTGVVTAIAPADDPGSSTPPQQIGYQVEWRSGQPATVTQFQGSPPPLPSAPTSTSDPTECNWTMSTPQKVVYQGEWITQNASVVCTTDVTSVSGTDDLYRGVTAGPYLIGQDFESENTNAANWAVTGTCHTSTWAYWAALFYSPCSVVNGCYQFGPRDSATHYWTC